MGATSTGLMTLAMSSLMALACTYRTDLLAGSPAGGDSGPRTGGTTTLLGQGGMGGSMLTGGTATGGTTSTGASAPTSNDRACTSDDDCVQCVYATAPNNPDQCEKALGCCGGPVMNKPACATNQAAWQANCSNRGYTAPVCPCIIPCSGPSLLTCRNGECGYWC
jgi:hypothetical protein